MNYTNEYFARKYDNKSFYLHALYNNYTESEVVMESFNMLFPTVKSGEGRHVRYTDDHWNRVEGDNEVMTCADVYGKFILPEGEYYTGCLFSFFRCLNFYKIKKF